jgi:hypothetical protein
MAAQLATEQDVVDRLGRELTDDEIERVPALIDEASATVESYLHRWFKDDDDIPRAVTIVVSRMVARRLANGGEGGGDMGGVPDGVSSLSAIDYSASFSEPFVSLGVWLNNQDRCILRPYRWAMEPVALCTERSDDRGRMRWRRGGVVWI